MAESETKLKKLIEKIAKEQKYNQARIEINPTTSGGANYTTNLYLIVISEPLKPDINLFAKVANLNEVARTKNEMMTNIYLTEPMFYTELVVNFERIYQKNNVAAEHKLNLPKYYGHDLTTMEETMVLENLQVKGFQNFDRMKTFNWEYASTAVQQMARFHAIGLAFRDENPTEFERVVDHFQVDILNGEDTRMLFIQQSIKKSYEVIGIEYEKLVTRYFTTNDVMVMIMKQFAVDKTLLVHGDFRPSNLMHRRRKGKLDIIPLDYQTLRMGNPVGDLMLFIFSGSDEEFRRFHYERLLDHYHSELTLALQNLQIDVEKIYSKKTFERDLIDLKPLGLVMGLTLVSLVTVAEENAAKIEGDLADFSVKPNELALERIKGIVRDYIRWGVL